MLRFNPKTQIAIPLSLDHLAEVREFVRTNAEQTRLDEDQIALFEVAVVECITNVIRHATGVPSGEFISVFVADVDGYFKCAVKYRGDPHEPDTDHCQEPSLDDYPEGGFGVFIIMSACTHVHFEHIDGHNLVTMELLQKIQ